MVDILFFHLWDGSAIRENTSRPFGVLTHVWTIVLFTLFLCTSLWTHLIFSPWYEPAIRENTSRRRRVCVSTCLNNLTFKFLWIFLRFASVNCDWWTNISHSFRYFLVFMCVWRVVFVNLLYFIYAWTLFSSFLIDHLCRSFIIICIFVRIHLIKVILFVAYVY
jgi:hypothetical protein